MQEVIDLISMRSLRYITELSMRVLRYATELR